MKYFTAFVTAVVMIAMTAPAFALYCDHRGCHDEAPPVVTTHRDNTQPYSYGRPTRYDSYGGSGRYGFSGGFSIGGGNGYGGSSMPTLGSNGGDSACRRECTQVALGLLYSKCIDQCVANDGHNDPAPGNAIPGNLAAPIYSKPSATPTAHASLGESAGGAVDCATLERICRGTTGEAASECWRALDECD